MADTASSCVDQQNNYFFKSVDDLVNHLYSLSKNLSPIKLQKSLYFLFAYYGATYGSMGLNGEKRENDETSYPRYLFNAQFEAWRYGPVINEVYSKNKNEEYAPHEYTGSQNDDVMKYIGELFEQVNSVSDFGLVDRSHQDNSWSNVYKDGEQHIPMDNEQIIQEYRKRYVD